MLLRQDRALLALDLALDIAFHARRPGEVTGAAEVAERLGLARRGIEPMLQALVRAGILDSQRGPRGGYRLARPAREVRLDALLAAVMDEEAPPAPAGPLAAAVTAPLWAELDALLTERLRGLTLEELLRRAARAGLRRATTEPLHFVI
jgi:Rrf2 family protein